MTDKPTRDIDPTAPRDPSEEPTIEIKTVRGPSGMAHGSVRDHVRRIERAAVARATDEQARRLCTQFALVIDDKDSQIATQARTIHRLEARCTKLAKYVERIGDLSACIDELEGGSNGHGVHNG